MAPEMLMLQHMVDEDGYTEAVDYWSLGITMYRLVTGEMPFHDTHVTQFMNYQKDAVAEPQCSTPSAATAARNATVAANKRMEHPAFEKAVKKLTYLVVENYGCSSAMDIILALLEADATRRIGCGRAGVREIKQHAFFENISWRSLEQKKVMPPYLPTMSKATTPKRMDSRNVPAFDQNVVPAAQDAHANFEAMMLDIGRSDWLRQKIADRDQEFFDSW